MTTQVEESLRILTKLGALDFAGVATPGLTAPGAPHGVISFLAAVNGLVAFGGALRCFAVSSHERLPSISEWNDLCGWRADFGALTDGLYFFGEDAFGNQFGVDANHTVVRFAAETGDREFVAPNIPSALLRLVSDPDDELGLWLLTEWKSEGNELTLAEHVCPKQPFVVGGAHETKNLYALDRFASMAFKGEVAQQVHSLPSGTKIKFELDP